MSNSVTLSVGCRAIAYIEELFRGNADGHDAAHSLRVYRNAMKIAEKEPEPSRTAESTADLCRNPCSISMISCCS